MAAEAIGPHRNNERSPDIRFEWLGLHSLHLAHEI